MIAAADVVSADPDMIAIFAAASGTIGMANTLAVPDIVDTSGRMRMRSATMIRV